MLFDLLLFGALIPSCAAGCLALIYSRWSRSSSHGHAVAPVAIGGAFVIAFGAYFGFSGVIAPQSWHWIFWASVAALPASFLRGRFATAPVLGAFVAIAAALLLWPMIGKLVPHELDPVQAWQWTLGLAVLFGVLTWLLDVGTRSFSSRQLAPALVAYAAGFAALCFELGSARLGQIGGFVAAALGALLVLSWFQPQRAWLHGASVVLVLVLGQTAANTYFFGYNVEGLPLLLTALPVLVLAIATRWSWLNKAKPIPAVVIVVALVALPLGLAYFVASSGGEQLPYGESTLPY